MKILYVATVRSHIGQFHMPFIKNLKEQGHEVHAAFKDNSQDKQGLDLSAIDETFEIPFERSPFKLQNIKAYFALKKVIDQGEYDIIHCHTPMGAVITRLAALKARKKGTKVFYTAHGFHFYKGAPLKNWFIFYPVEKILSRFTDVLILINEEDYQLAVTKNFKAQKICKTHGVGVELDKFDDSLCEKKEELRKQYDYPENMFAMIYPADLSKRKNQKMLLETVRILKKKIPDLKLLLPGQPIMLEEYKKLAKQYDIEEKVEFLGYRRDIPELLALSDVSVSSSRQEGLPINIVEAMAMGKPVVATAVRGNEDLVMAKKGGFLIKLNDSREMARAIYALYTHQNMFDRIGEFNKKHIRQFSTECVIRELEEIYFREL